MYVEEIIAVGERMEIKINNVFIRTKLQELYDNGRFTVFHPTVKGLPVMLETGDVFALRFYRPNGVFTFDALLVDWYSKDDIRLCLFEPKTGVSKVQRRQSYRLPIVLDVAVRLADEDADENKPAKGMTVDLSEHGVLLTSFTWMPVDTKVFVELKLSPSQTMGLNAKVLRCEKPIDKKQPFKIVLLFTNSSDRQRADLSRYILRQQINTRKKTNQEVRP